ncbi:hypothetical protein GCM10028810_20960 [Spirosoma litoris]
MSNDDLLKALSTQIDKVLISLEPFVVQYHDTWEGLIKFDVSKDKTYQSNFIRFFRLPRTDCYNYYFDFLERREHNTDLSYADVLTELQSITDRLESSFASKLVATVDPRHPVIGCFKICSVFCCKSKMDLQQFIGDFS